MCFLDRVYKTLIISTIVDKKDTPKRSGVYKTFIISTIVDSIVMLPFRLSIKHL